MQKGLFYKSKCLKTLRGAICNEAPRFTDSTIAQAIMLAYDEVSGLGFFLSPLLFFWFPLLRNMVLSA